MRNTSNLSRLTFAILVWTFLAVAGCSFSTAHISSLTLSKDKGGSQPATSFGIHDTFYAKGEAANVPGKITLKWKLVAEKVEGQKENTAIPQLDKSFDLPGDGSSTYNLSPPDAGWPAGTYRIELSLLNDSGEQKDQKVVTFTVAGD